MSVFVSDEQSSVALDLPRWVRLAQLALTEERVPHDAELSLIFVDEDSIADLNRRFLDGPGATDVLAFPIDDDLVPGGRRPDEGGRGPGFAARARGPAGRARRRGDLPDGRRSARRPSTRSRSTTSSRSWSCTGSCIC